MVEKTGFGPAALAIFKSNGLIAVGLGNEGGTSSTFRFESGLDSAGIATVLDAKPSLVSGLELCVLRITKRHNAITSKPTAILYDRLFEEDGAVVFGRFEVDVAATEDVAIAGEAATADIAIADEGCTASLAELSFGLG